MRQLRRTAVSLVALGCLVLLPPNASAQQTGSGLAGVVKDSTGAVLPGVTVEAASPALIEKVRSVVTDEQGLYKIVDLRPGTYTVTFTLPGFSIVKREGIELPSNFTATINSELNVGSMEETITVSGQTPVVDVQNTAVRNLIPRSVLDAVPSSRATAGLVAMTPGIVGPATAQDVGGTKGEQSLKISIHGGHSSDMRQLVDGIEINMPHGNGNRQFQPTTENAQEVSVDLGGGGAENGMGGVMVNFIPKDGGNLFSGNFLTNFSNGSLQGSNLSEELRARGLTEKNISKVKNVWDLSGSFGGPLKQNRLWFFTAHRKWASANYVAASFENATPESYLYTPDFNRPGLNDYTNHTHNFRVTWQVSARNRLRMSYDYQWRCDCHRPASSTVAPEASNYQTYPAKVLMATWTFPATNRLLFEAGTARLVYVYTQGRQPGMPLDRIAVTDTGLNLKYRANTYYETWRNWTEHSRFSMSYITGSHAFKTGVTLRQVREDDFGSANASMNYTFRNQVPTSITIWADPFYFKEHVNADLGLFAQDQWTIKRLTLNMGLRLDYINESVDPQQEPAGRFVPARDFAGVSCVACFTDLSPRLSASYDLFGTGKTALKASWGGYLGGESLGITHASNPVVTSVQSATRAWDDKKAVPGGIPNDFIPQEAELGPLSDSNFGGQIVTTHYADDVTKGFGHRSRNWQTSAGIQHELWPGTAINFGYFRTVWTHNTVTDNLKLTPADFDPYCINIPVDSRLPGSGTALCGLYDLNQAKFGQVDNLVSQASKFGKQIETYDGFDLTVNARLPRGAYLGGGMSTGRTVNDDCAVLQDSPQKLFCRISPPFLQPQIKVYGIYPLPWDFQASATLQSVPGIPISASYSATLAEIRPTLVRPLSGSRTSVIIDNLFQPQTQFEGRINQVDVRLTRTIKAGRLQLNPRFDIYNLLNSSAVLSTNTRFGPTWLQPAQILDARLIKFEIQVQF